MVITRPATYHLGNFLIKNIKSPNSVLLGKHLGWSTLMDRDTNKGLQRHDDWPKHKSIIDDSIPNGCVVNV